MQPFLEVLWTRLLQSIGHHVFENVLKPAPVLPPSEWGEKDSPVLTAVSVPFMYLERQPVSSFLYPHRSVDFNPIVDASPRERQFHTYLVDSLGRSF